MDNLLDTNELADFLGASIDDLKNWRRLPADHEGHLPSTLVDGRHRYAPDVVVAWLVRNPKRLALARFLFDERIALAHAAALRDTPALEPIGPDHPSVAACLDPLAALYVNMKRDSEALELKTRAERIRAMTR